MLKYIINLILIVNLVGCGQSPKDGAYSFVANELQEKQKIFKDQYDLSMPLDNNRGSIVVAEITDKKLLTDGGNKFIVHLLTKAQGFDKDSGVYASQYSRVFLEKKPTKEKINELAKDKNLL